MPVSEVCHPYLHSQMVQRHVLAVDVQRVMFGHGEHLLEVGLDLAAVLCVDGVPVAGHWRALVSSYVWV